jgi:hypothetical protein
MGAYRSLEKMILNISNKQQEENDAFEHYATSKTTLESSFPDMINVFKNIAVFLNML